MHSQSLFLIFNFLAKFLSCSHAKPGWLKVCSGDNNYEIHAGGCPNGVVLKSPISVSCVCVNGVHHLNFMGICQIRWILAQGSCDTMPYLLVGKGDCFALDNVQISSMKFIGRPSSPFTSRSYQGTESLNAFWKLSTSLDAHRKIPKLNAVSIIQINSDRVVTSENAACCVRDPFYETQPVHICLEAPDHRYFLRPKCLRSSKRSRQLNRVALNFGQGIQLGRLNINQTTLIRASSSCRSCSATKQKSRFETDCCQALAFEDVLDDSHVDPKRYEKQANRMAGKYMNFMKNQKGGEWTVNTNEFNLLRYSSLIMSKVCPVSRDLLNTFVRFFRYLVNESISEFPMEKTIDDYQNGRIIQTLGDCLNTVDKEWKFQRKSCDAEIDTVITSNRTIKLSTSRTKLQTDMKDLTIETTWIIIKFIGRFCSSSFDENPTDLDYLLTGLQKLITADLTKRWYNPGKTYDAIHFLLHDSDLLTFMNEIETCAEAAESFSTQKRILVPPTIQEEPKNKLESGPIWEDQGTCLMSYWYPFSNYTAASC